MAYLAVMLIIFGGALLVAEIFTPGFGVFGISGILCIIASAVLTVLYVPFGPFILIGEFAVLACLVMYFLDYVRRKQLFGKIILDETLNFDEKEIGDLSFFLEKEGTSKTPLKPVGNVDFNGVVLEAYSDGAFIYENTKVKVVGVNGNKLIVKAMKVQ